VAVELALSCTCQSSARHKLFHSECIAWCACVLPSFHCYSLHVPTDGWPDCVDYTEIVHLRPTDTHSITNYARHKSNFVAITLITKSKESFFLLQKRRLFILYIFFAIHTRAACEKFAVLCCR